MSPRGRLRSDAGRPRCAPSLRLRPLAPTLAALASRCVLAASIAEKRAASAACTTSTAPSASASWTTSIASATPPPASAPGPLGRAAGPPSTPREGRAPLTLAGGARAADRAPACPPPKASSTLVAHAALPPSAPPPPAPRSPKLAAASPPFAAPAGLPLLRPLAAAVLVEMIGLPRTGRTGVSSSTVRLLVELSARRHFDGGGHGTTSSSSSHAAASSRLRVPFPCCSCGCCCCC